jgi:pyruvate kinase
LFGLVTPKQTKRPFNCESSLQKVLPRVATHEELCMERRTKIVATIGPATEDEARMRDLITAGMNVARINFSHGTKQEHAERIRRLRHASDELDMPITILQDLQGPKIRTGVLKDDQIELVPGKTLTLTSRQIAGDQQRVSIDFPDLPHVVKPGRRILLADGQMELRVLSTTEDEVITEIVLGGTLTAHKGVNLPGTSLNIPGFTEKDEEDLAFGLTQGIDAVAMSFVRTSEDVLRVRQAITRYASEQVHLPIIAKLERPEALDNLDDIIAAAEGVMVARGDLGVEMSPQEVPIAQKRIIKCANENAKLVITATQMLESMIYNPRPTRAEASDVANAIFDGSDAVMLSGETAVGAFPVQTIEMMNSIICEAESNLEAWGHWLGKTPKDEDDAAYVTRAARELAHDRKVAAIAVFTMSGRTALLMSKERPAVPILAFTPSPDTNRRMAMYWGVLPHLVSEADNVETMLTHVEKTMIAETSIKPGQQIVLVCGYPVGARRSANLALLHTVGH